MDEARIEKAPQFGALAREMTELVDTIVRAAKELV
jgi:hypothetical protein